MNRKPVTIVGSYLSPYVRKVLVCLEVKQIEYVIDPIEPAFGSEPFSRPGAVHRLPVFIDENVTISDSTVICEYLQERYPQPAIYPDTPQTRARARWLEEYADTRMDAVFISNLFNERVIKPTVWGEASNEAVVARAVEQEAPQILDYLEHEFSPNHPFLFGHMGIAEITIASFMRNAGFAGYQIDAQRWPAMHAVVQHTLQHPSFLALQKFEELSLTTPIAQQREALLAANAPVALSSYDSFVTQRGILDTKSHSA